MDLITLDIQSSQPCKSSKVHIKLICGGSNNNSEGMVEVLAEINGRPLYFQQIQEDAQQFSTPIMEKWTYF